MSLKNDKITIPFVFSDFSAYKENSIDCADTKTIQFEKSSTDKYLSIISLMQDVNSIVLKK